MAYKLLLADDSVTIQRVIELTFADEDIKVAAVGDGQQAIERIEADPPDIILADIGMPKRDGYEVAGYVKSRPKLAHIPVVLLTGAFEPIDQARATSVGCDAVLAKPFEPQVVINRVKQLLGANAAGPSHRAAVTVPASRVAEPAVVAADLRAADNKPPPPHSPSDPGSELMMDVMRPKAQAADLNVSLDDYFDQLDAAFSKLGGSQPSSEAISELPSRQQDSSADFDWAQKPVRQTAPGPAALEEALTGLKQAGVGEFEWVAPGQTAPLADSDNFDFSGVTGIDVDAPLASIGPDAPLRPSDLTTEPSKPKFTREEPSMPQPVDRPIVGVTAPEAPKAPAAAPPSPAPIADAFAALLAAEQGETPAERVVAAPRPAPAPVAPAPVAVTDALVEQVTQRVLDRLSDKVVRDTVTEMVSRVAERLVREEIERIKRGE